MPRLLIPPRGYFVPSVVIFHPHLKAQIRDTLIQLMALSWGSDSHSNRPYSCSLDSMSGWLHG